MEEEDTTAAAAAEEATVVADTNKVDMAVRHVVESIYSLLRCFTEGYSTGGGSYQQGYGGYSQGY